MSVNPAEQRSSAAERLRRYVRGRMRRLSYLGLHVLSRLCNALPLHWTIRLSTALGYLHYWATPRLRQRLVADLVSVLGIDAKQARKLLRTAYVVNDRAALEIVALSDTRTPLSRWSSLCTIEGLSQLRALAERRQGAILLGMHMGNGLMMAGQLAAAGLPVSVVFRQSRKMPEGFLHDVVARQGLEPIAVKHRDARAGTRQMLRALRGGRLLFVLMDQASKYGDDGVALNFLGKRTVLPDGLARLALMTSVPVIPILLHDVDPAWRFSVADPLPSTTESDPLVHAMADAMEQHIRSYPHYWSWHHRRWRREPLLSARGDTSA